MELKNIFENYPDLNLTIRSQDLKEFASTLIQNASTEFLQKYREKVYTRKEVMTKFNVSSATLWRWDKNGLINSIQVGGKKFYPESEIRRLSGLE